MIINSGLHRIEYLAFTGLVDLYDFSQVTLLGTFYVSSQNSYDGILTSSVVILGGRIWGDGWVLMRS